METKSTAQEIERLERKVDMTLDEIIKMQKKLERKAKKNTRKPFKNTSRNASQGSVASRSSSIRQGKLAQSRPHGLLTAKQAGFKALHTNDTSKVKRRNRKRSRNTTRPSGGATRNIRVLVSNELSRFSTGRRKVGAAARLNCAPDELDIDDPERNVQTLDSRFASLRGGRQVQFSGRHGF